MITLIYNGSGKATVVQYVSANGAAHIKDSFPSIDAACDFIQDSLNVEEGEIDDAVTKMHAHNHSNATFDNGKLVSTN